MSEERDDKKQVTKRRGLSLSLRIWLVFASVNVVTVVATLATTWYVSRMAVEERAHEQVRQQISTVERAYREEIVERLQYHLELLAGLPAVDEMLRSFGSEQSLRIDSMYRQFALITKDIEGYGAISYVMDDGALGMHLEDGKRMRDPHDLREPPDKQPTEILAAMAHVYADLVRRPLLLSSGNMEWFMPPRSLVGSAVVSNPKGDPSIIVGLAKLDVDTGAFGGAVMIRYDLKKFVQRLADTRILGAGGAWVFDHNGMTLLSPGEASSGPFPTALLARHKAGRRLVQSEAGGIVGIGTLRAARGAPPMRFAIKVPSSAFASELDPLFLVFAATVGASALLFGIVSIVASRGLTRPITALQNAASRLADGDFSVRTGSRNGGEIGELEDSFDRMAENLQSAIRSRDRSLERLLEQSREQERLIRARIEAEAAASASSEFLAHMSHELRTPLNSIIGFTDIMSKKLFGPLGHAKYDEYVTDVSYSANHLLGLISDILDLSKIEAGQMEPDEAAIDIAALVQESAIIVRPAARQDLAAVKVLTEAALPELMGDERMLKQVVVNLLSNAIKFTPATGLIKVESLRLPSGGMEISVSDNGCGIPADKIDHVLQPFGQARSGSKTSHQGGTGLGLSLSRRLIELNGGELTLESELNKGTTVRLTFPPDRIKPEGADVVNLDSVRNSA